MDWIKSLDDTLRPDFNHQQAVRSQPYPGGRDKHSSKTSETFLLKSYFGPNMVEETTCVSENSVSRASKGPQTKARRPAAEWEKRPISHCLLFHVC